MRGKSGNFRGSFTLEAIFSTTFGLVFIGLFVNLVNYVTASNAIEQTARKVARCLTPTDAGCPIYAANVPTTNIPWYGLDGGITDKKEIIVPQARYSAKMIQEHFTADYDTFSTHYVTPVAAVPVMDLPVRKFSIALNPFEYHFAKIVKTIRGVVGGSATIEPLELGTDGTNFPPFVKDGDPRAELIRKNQGMARWFDGADLGSHKFFGLTFVQDSIDQNATATHTTKDPNDPSLPQVPFGFFVPSGHTATIYYNWVFVPPIDNANGAAALKTGFNFNKIKTLAGAASGDKHDWQSFAHLAIKGFSRAFAVTKNRRSQWVIDPKSKAQVRWGIDAPGSDEVSSGMELNFSNDGVSEASSPSAVDLGGRDWEEAQDGLQFHLRLRGPAASNGAGTDNPEDVPSFAWHENLTVKRGTYFRVVLHFSAKDGPIVVNPDVFHYFDQYKTTYVGGQTDQATGECDTTVKLLPNQPIPTDVACPDDSLCNLSNGGRKEGAVYQPDHCEPGSVTTVSSCTNDGTAFLAGGAETADATAVMCDESTVPVLADIGLPQNRLACGAPTGETLGRAFVGKDSACGAATLDHEVSCDGERLFHTDGNYGELATTCGGLTEEISSLNNFAQDNQPVWAPHLESISLNDAHWTDKIADGTDNWKPSWQPMTDDQGKTITDSSAMKSVHHQIQNSTAVYKQEPAVKPDHAIFTLEIPAGLGAPPAGFFDTSFHISGPSEESRALKSGIFSGEPVPVIPYWGPTGSSDPADYNQDCKLEDKCSDSFQSYSSLEEAMRAQAGAEIPQAKNPTTVFDFHVEPAAPKIFNNEADFKEFASATSLPACTPTQTICKVGSGDGTPIHLSFLGEFSSSEFPDGPAACHGPTPKYTMCHPEFPADFTPPTVQLTPVVSQAAVENAAKSEIAKVLPAAQWGCASSGTPGCVDLNYDVTSDPQYDSVTLTYNVPLFPPLSTFTGKSAWTIQHTKKEAKELL